MKPIRFEKIGGEWVDPPVLMPAALPLELSGEAVRTRLITSADVPGEELALRPDLTLAVANHHIEKGSEGAVSYRYFGKAFRQPVAENEPMEFYQSGFECFGHEDRAERDVAVLTSICEAVAEAGLKNIRMNIGIVSIFPEFVSALKLSSFWQDQLNRAFRKREGIKTLLNREEELPRSALATTLAEVPQDQAEALLDEVLAMSGGQVIGGRTREDILNRLQTRAKAVGEGPLNPDARRILEKLVGLEGKPDDVLSALRALAQASGVDVEASLERAHAMFSRLGAEKLPFWSDAYFSIGFGRRFDYYDGLVFELSHTGLGAARPVAAGGRYDGLISRLSHGQMNAPAVGGVIRPDRIAQALAAEGGANA